MRVRIVKEVKKRLMACDVSPVAMFLVSEGSKNLGAMKLVIYSINLGIFI